MVNAETAVEIIESQEIVNDIDNILKLKIPQKYLQTLNGKNYESFEKRLDYITVSSKQEFSELKRAEKMTTSRQLTNALIL